MINKIKEQIEENIKNRFSKKDLFFYKENIEKLKKEVVTKEIVPQNEVSDYCFYLMLKENKNISREDIGLLYFALN